jgi:serine protease inhibitor
MVEADVPTVRVNHPFIFLIRYIETGAVLFMGQVMNPTVKAFGDDYV